MCKAVILHSSNLLKSIHVFYQTIAKQKQTKKTQKTLFTVNSIMAL